MFWLFSLFIMPRPPVALGLVYAATHSSLQMTSQRVVVALRMFMFGYDARYDTL